MKYFSGILSKSLPYRNDSLNLSGMFSYFEHSFQNFKNALSDQL